MMEKILCFFCCGSSDMMKREKRGKKRELKSDGWKGQNLWKMRMRFGKAKMKKQSLNHPFWVAFTMTNFVAWSIITNIFEFPSFIFIMSVKSIPTRSVGWINGLLSPCPILLCCTLDNLWCFLQHLFSCHVTNSADTLHTMFFQLQNVLHEYLHESLQLIIFWTPQAWRVAVDHRVNSCVYLYDKSLLQSTYTGSHQPQ